MKRPLILLALLPLGLWSIFALPDILAAPPVFGTGAGRWFIFPAYSHCGG